MGWSIPFPLIEVMLYERAALVYLDDVIIFFKTTDEHFKNFEIILEN